MWLGLATDSVLIKEVSFIGVSFIETFHYIYIWLRFQPSGLPAAVSLLSSVALPSILIDIPHSILSSSMVLLGDHHYLYGSSITQWGFSLHQSLTEVCYSY